MGEARDGGTPSICSNAHTDTFPRRERVSRNALVEHTNLIG